jgi:gas vesicle protein
MFPFIEKYKRTQRRKTVFTALFAGVASAVAAVLLTPVSGKQARTALKDKAKETGTWAKDKGVELGSKAQEISSQAKQKAVETSQRVVDSLKHNKDEVADKASRAERAAEEELKK